MKVFEVVGRTRSFTRAAQLLNLTQSAVSRQVRNLEAQLGEDLVIRRHHDLELTRAGADLLATLQQAFQQVEQTVRTITDKNNRNRQRINAPPTCARRCRCPTSSAPPRRRATATASVRCSTRCRPTSRAR